MNLFSVTFENINQQPDTIDQGTTENLRLNHHAFHEHEKRLCRQIELALRRLACGNYGYCIITGNPIGVNRLIVAPYTAYCVDAQEEQEKQEQRKRKILDKSEFLPTENVYS